MIKVGRPKLKTPRDNQVNIRMTDEALDKLEDICKRTGRSKTSAVEAAINLWYTKIHQYD